MIFKIEIKNLNYYFLPEFLAIFTFISQESCQFFPASTEVAIQDMCWFQMLKVRQMLTEVLLEVTNREIDDVAHSVYSHAKRKQALGKSTKIHCFTKLSINKLFVRFYRKYICEIKANVALNDFIYSNAMQKNLS